MSRLTNPVFLVFWYTPNANNGVCFFSPDCVTDIHVLGYFRDVYLFFSKLHNILLYVEDAVGGQPHQGQVDVPSV